MKAQVVADAFSRIGRIPLEQGVPVAASPERGSRMRARLHVRGSRLGFYREGTHEICDAAQTGHLLDESLRAASAALAALTAAGMSIASLELSENIAADQRAIHVEPTAGSSVAPKALADAVRAGALTGCTALNADGRLAVAGTPLVSDPLPVLTRGRAGAGELERQPASFFQANRYLLPDLVVSVLDAVPSEGDVLDLYAGVGLFSVALAASGRERITAVEGDRSSASDLQRNAARCGAVRVVIASVEEHLASSRRPVAAIIVDPPRTGISKEAIEAIVRQSAAWIIYVSCDPPTMARDARRLVDGGYRLESLRAFDLFPNTPHVETLGVFTQEKGEGL